MAEQADRENTGWGQALATLRLVRGWRQKRLAAAGGIADSTLSCYERGVKPAPIALLRQSVAAMGFPPHLLDEAHSLVLWAQAKRRPPGGSATTSASPIAIMAREAALEMERLVRQVLTAVLQEGPEAAMEVARGEGARTSTGPWRPPEPSALPAVVGPPPGPAVAAAAAAAGPPQRGARRTGRPVRDRGGPLPKALRILRQVVCDLDRPELAALAGLSVDRIKAYELDVNSSPDNLDRLLAAMGLPLVVLERMIAFVEVARAARGSLGRSAPVLDAQIAGFSAAEARREEEARRALLGRLEAAAVLLDARRRAPDLWARLARYPHVGRQALIREVADFQDAGLAELLCQESIKAAGDSAREALRLARLAVLASERVPAERGGGMRLEAFCRVHVANALRVSGRLLAADTALARAREQWQASDGPGLLNEARVLQIEASLRRDQRRFPEAVGLLDSALAIDRWGETTSLLIGKSYALWGMRDFEGSIALLRQILPLTDSEHGMRNLFAVRVNLAFNLCDLGQHAAAGLAVREIRVLAKRLGNRLDTLRVTWLEAKVAAGMGQIEAAVAAFQRVYAGFERQRLAYDAALVALEVAELHASLGRTPEVKALARKAAPIFRAQGVHREARRALELFRSAAEQERASVALIRSVVSYLQEARRDRTLRYREVA
jgi:transcriptional regulator with XRE-family HTH domain